MHQPETENIGEHTENIKDKHGRDMKSIENDKQKQMHRQDRANQRKIFLTGCHLHFTAKDLFYVVDTFFQANFPVFHNFPILAQINIYKHINILSILVYTYKAYL